MIVLFCVCYAHVRVHLAATAAAVCVHPATVGAVRVQSDTVGAVCVQPDTLGAVRVQPDTVGSVRVQSDTVGAVRVQSDTVGAVRVQPDTVGAVRVRPPSMEAVWAMSRILNYPTKSTYTDTCSYNSYHYYRMATYDMRTCNRCCLLRTVYHHI